MGAASFHGQAVIDDELQKQLASIIIEENEKGLFAQRQHEDAEAILAYQARTIEGLKSKNKELEDKLCQAL